MSNKTTRIMKKNPDNDKHFRYRQYTVGEMIEKLKMYADIYGYDTELCVNAGKHLCQHDTIAVNASYSSISLEAYDTWSDKQDENNPDWFKEEYEKDIEK